MLLVFLEAAKELAPKAKVSKDPDDPSLLIHHHELSPGRDKIPEGAVVQIL